jgi:hypothetical protein
VKIVLILCFVGLLFLLLTLFLNFFLVGPLPSLPYGLSGNVLVKNVKIVSLNKVNGRVSFLLFTSMMRYP